MPHTQTFSEIQSPIKTHYSQAILFDLDGTLVDSAPDLVQAGLYSLRKHNIIDKSHPIHHDNQIFSFTGAGSRFFIDKTIDMLGANVSEETRQQMQKDFIDYYFKHIDVYTKPYEGATQLLEKLKKDGMGLAICTNKTEILTHNLLHRLHLHNYFDVIIGADTLNKPKPAPDCVLYCGAYFDIPTQNMIMIGDSYKDMAAAHKVGAGRIAAAYGYCYDDFSQYNVYAHIEKIEDAYKAICQYYQDLNTSNA